MKRFTSFLISLLLAIVAMAQSETKTITVTPSEGSFLHTNGSTVTSGYAYKWQSSATDYSVTITAAKDGTSKNNMDAAVTDGFSMWVGDDYSTYTFSFADCQILSYSFKFKSNATGNHVTVTPTGGEAVTSTDDEQELTVSDVNASSASIQLSGSNYAILVTELTFTVMTSPFTSGSVYHFQNIGNTAVALGASALTDVAAVTSDKESTSQHWYCERVDGYYTFRNLSNGRYLKGNGASGGYSLTDNYSDGANKFNLVFPEKNGDTTYEGYTIYSTSNDKGTTGGGGSMHRDDGNNIVGWGSYNSNTRWTISAIEYTEEELTANWNRVTELTPDSTTVSGYQKKLEAIFTDVACTILNDAYTTTNMTDDQLADDANYSALPTTLQNMVKKVRGGDWSEKTVDPAERPNGNNSTNVPTTMWTVEDTWENDYAKRFRVQMYEPYSVEGEITTYLGFNAHCNMDNPTGIYANTNQAIYIMVEGDIKDGAELWLAHQAGNGATSYYNNSAYTELHKGLNVVPYFTDGCQMWINYVVHTYKGSGTTIAEKFPHKLSDYKPLKIHIEGGYINGYFNAMGDFRAADSGTEDLWGEVDNDEDWDYYKARAALANDFALLGHRQTLLFPFGAWDSTNGYFVVANDGGGIDKALAYWLENIQVPDTTNCYGGSGNTYGDFSDTYYPGMNLDKDNGKINIMLEAWDRIMYSEHATMGLLGKTEIDWMNKLYPGWTAENTTFDIYNYGSNDTGDTYKAFCNGLDYSDYYNHHGAAVGAASGYMSGGWRVCNYHYNTMGSIIGEIAVAAGPTWGPAHEIGHQHQRVFNLNGQTEVTNNFFSNVAVWYMGMGTSRYNGSQGSLSSVLDAYNTDNNDLYTNNIWAITHLYYRLWLYYHLAGNNTQFWPRLFELCRQIPIVNGGQISGETSLLRFYQHACTAAGEDLTEFFRAHGYFELMTDRLVGDYSNATYNITEEQIETAITAVEAEGYPKNYAILLINDGTSDTTVKHNGTSKRALWDGSASAEYGSVTDFIEGNTSITTAYDAVVSADGTVTMSGGEGGVGFLVFNEDGELVSFSNKSTFELSDEAAYLLATGKATIVAVDAENNTEEAEVDLSAIQREMLGALIAKIGAMPIDDGSYRYIGFYTKSSAQELLDVLESAKTVYASNSGYGAAYEMLYTAKEEFVNSQNLSYVPFDPDLTYIITSYAYGNTMHLSSGAAVGTGIDEEATTSQWQFKTTGTDGVYKLYNVAGYYLTTPAKSAKVGSSSTESDGAAFSLIQDSPVGAWTISLSPAAEYTTLHDDSFGKVVGWESGVNASKWYLKATTDNSSNAPKTDALQALVSKTDALVNLVGEISYTINTTPVALQTTNTTGDYYVRTNATNTGGSNEGPIANLVDGGTDNYFHTQWANNAISDDNLDHYIEVNMGSGKLAAFNFSYTTRGGGATNDFPQVIKVYGSNTENTTGDESEYVLLAEISSGLPKTAGTFYNSSAVDGGIAYQYLRFMVPTTTTTRNVQHNYWHMAEFDISAATASATALTDYSSISADIILTAYNAVNAAKSYINYANVTDEQITSATSTLQDAYDALKDAYDAVIQNKKDELEDLADATDILVDSVGSIERSRVTALALTTDNLYCNAPYTAQNNSDYSAEYVSKLIDGSATTFLHTDYSGAIAAPHYLRVYLGESSTAKSFKFNYTTRDNGNNCPTTILIEGSNEAEEGYSTITTLTAAANGLPNPDPNTNGGVAESFESSVISMGAAYKYIRFKVTGVEGGNATFFVMSEFGFSTVEDIVTIEDAFEGIVSEDLWLSTYHASGDSHTMAAEGSYATLAQVEAQIVKLTEAKAVLEAAMNQVDKSALETSLAAINPLYEKMGNDDGTVKEYYASSALTDEQMTEIKAAIDAAQAVVENAGATQLQVNEAKDAIDAKYEILSGIESTDVTAREELTTLIDNVNTLLGTIAETCAAENVAVPLQTTEGDDFYIWCNSPASDSQGVAGLIDKNADGTANTGTFLGTAWGSTVAAYTHYIEVDLGEGITIDNLLFDYTTRDSDHSNQRPTAIKILGSNNKTDYTEITIISDGLATGQCEQWSMAETLELGAPYRYIRFAIATDESTGYFNMSDFNLYAIIGHTLALKEYYTTATGLEFDALCIALQSAQYAAEHYLTSDRLTEVKDKLNSYYTAINTIVEADVDDRTGLTDLVTATETLIEEVATVAEVDAVTLTEGMLYCNADNSTNESAGDSDKRGVAALIDGDLTTHLHTTYGNNAQSDDLDHYIRVDLGDASAVTAFKFNYRGRQENSNNAPTNMTVEAGNSIEADAEWVTLATLTELPTGTAPVSYESGLIEMSEAYRYVRFMVTATQNNAYTTYNDIQHKFFVMSEFGFESYPTVDVDEENYLNVTTELVRTAYNEKNSANDVATNYYMAESDYTAALDELQAAYDALEGAKAVSKDALAALIEATTLLKGQMYETAITSYTPSSVTLQNETEGAAGYLYCNAPETNSDWGTDNAGVAALIDLTDGNPNLDTFLHTEYGNDQSADGLDHYLRVDLGDGGETDYIEFGYYGRSDHTAKSPKKVIVAATNDLDGEWTTIDTLNPSEASASTETKTGCLGNGVAYRYWRFLVEETYMSSNGTDGNGHPYFCMTQFNVYKCTDVVKTEQLKYTPNIYIYVTDDLVTEVTDAIAAATTVNGDEAATQAAVNAAVDALQPVHDKLEEALKFAGVPVKITTDEANPVLYNIISKRATDGSKVLQYCEFDATNPNTVSVSAIAANSSYQAWYFMESTNGVTIKPFNGQGKALGADATDNGNTKVWAAEVGTKSYYEWKFVARTDGYYNIQVHDGINYFSNCNGEDYKMGFWSGEPDTDPGSLFKFVDATFENDNARYYQLSDFENTLEYQTSVTPEGTTVGAFTNGAAYSTAYSAASTLIEAGNTSDAVACKDAYTALRTASATVERIEPVAGKIYRIYITPGLTDSREGASMRIGDNGKLACGEYSAAITDYYFAFEYDADGKLYMKSLHSGTYLDEALANNTKTAVGADAESIEDARAVAINTLGASGDAVVVGIVPTRGAMLNCAAKEGDVVAYNNTAVDKASAWVIEEVTEETVTENIKQSVTLTESNDGNKYSTLYLGYNATIPEGVTASIVTGLNSIGQLILEDVTESITGGEAILPAKTAVVLSGDVSDAKEFAYTKTSEYIGTCVNILRGTAYTKYVACGTDCADSKIYMLAKKSGRVAFYWAYANRDANGNYVYVNADNEICESTDEGAHKNHNKGGYVKCNANKSYLQLDNGNDEANQAAVAMFGFFFGGNTTDIDSINAVARVYEGSVFDLQGRKLDKVTEPGIYIVNGKKVFVQEVE
ncbi:MAG: discoidin domain-containing protein [Bacteroidaceae bacterium]|nr:discoidin domain-containing protein [Bacteroidaceae bacterium]